ncbi:MAG TPA: sugar phosphate isomerase/epimerase family protein [Acidobacteriota bacterium]|nr:sugar phosphate isomerase/epimerase family protein [Acidobacteriota bacterium]
MNRRNFLKGAAVIAGAAGSGVTVASINGSAQSKPQRIGGSFVKLSCNVFSFNTPLTEGVMTLDEVLEFCAELGFSAVDPTGYYFPNYPKLPPDDYVYHIKRKAHLLGLDISGTGVRTDFTDPDAARRDEDVEVARSWTDCAVKMGAPAVRIFAGRGVPEGHTREEVAQWVVRAVRRCADYGKTRGVMMALQNHADFIQTADENLALLKMVDSDWLAANVDIGSFRTGDPYEEIAKVAPYAITWQIKENLFIRDKETRTDLNKIAAILKKAGYRGYIQLETLGTGDPKSKMPRFLDQVRKAIS